MNSKNYSIIYFFIALVCGSCSSFFGTKTDLSFIAVPDYSVKPVAYVPIQPILQGFVNPTDIITGYDQLIYVVDAGTEEIIAYDESLKELSRLKVPGVTTIAQDRRLDLYALGTFDTTINAVPFKLGCIYKFQLKNTEYGLAKAELMQKIVHPFYITSAVKLADNNVRFNGIGTLADNGFYVTRTGPSTNNLIGGPDDAVLYFNGDLDNAYQFNVQVVTSSEGLRNDYFTKPTGLVTFVQPPQSNGIKDNREFAFITNNPQEPLKAKFITYTIVEDAPTFQLNQDLVVGDTSKADGFLYTPRKLTSPSDIAFSGDGTQLVFITDAVKDSLYIYTNTGLEGVNAPAGSKSRKNIKVSFGGNGQALNQFDSPVAVCYSNKIVYVVDGGNKRILRFKLTTDFK